MPDHGPSEAVVSPALEAVGLRKDYVLERSLFGRPVRMLAAVDGVDLSLARGETIGIVGESGSGKSTLARLVAQLIAPDAGVVRILGREIGTSREDQRWLRRNVQVVLQDPYSSLDPTKTVGHAIREPLVVQHLGTSSERKDAPARLLERVGLPSSFEGRYPEELSGGQRQRVAIARALATQPAVIIADEPTSALDISTRSEILNLLLDLQEAEGLSLMVISHDFATVEHLSHRLLVMYRGRVVEEGPTAVLTANPVHPYTNTLISAVLVPDPVVQRQRTRIRVNDQGLEEASWDTCAFAARCPAAEDVCWHEPAPSVDLGDGRRVRCHFSAEFSDVPGGGSAAAGPMVEMGSS